MTTGDVHSSDADDEQDGSTMSIQGSENESPDVSPTYGRDNGESCCATVGSTLLQPGLTSDLRATATEFVPAQNGTVLSIQSKIIPSH